MRPVMAKKPVVLIIRDGWGVNPGGQQTAEKDGNATLLANTPFHDVMLDQYPKGFLSASGLDVGLPEGQMGNSEVGHLNLGAGRREQLMRYISVLEDALGMKAQLNMMPVQDGDVARTEADVTETRAALGYAPSTPIDVGVKRFVDWYRDFYGV